MRDMDFPQGHVGKRDLKRKREEHDYLTANKSSSPPFPLLKRDLDYSAGPSLP
jgi:hypothetical protein